MKIDVKKIVTLITASGFLCLVVFTFGCTLAFGQPLHEEGEVTVSETYTSVDVNNISGNVTVKEWGETYTLVQYTKTALTQDALDNLYPSVQVQNGVLKIKRESYKRLLESGSISFRVFLPEKDNTLSIESISGSVSVENTEGGDDMTVSTVSGKIAIGGSGSLDLNSTSGSVSFTSENARSIKIYTTSGRIEGTVRSPQAAALLKSESISGHIDLTCPPDFAGTIEASSISGAIHSDYAASMRSAGGNSLTCSVGKGNVRIYASTVSGSITIKHD